MENAGGRAMLSIAKVLFGSIMAHKSPKQILQELARKISEILDVQRCVIFKLRDGVGTHDIEIVAGVPIEEHGIGLMEPLVKHPDIAAAIEDGKVTVIEDPMESSLTSYFHQTIEQKEIAEILYAPLISSLDKETIGVIVIDVRREKMFNKKKKKLCGEIAELVSLVIDYEGIIAQRMRDLVVNRTTSLGGYAFRLEKQAEGMVRMAHILAEEAMLIEKACPQKGDGINF
jgi:transcriptional regulator with GAF, ATPase, and Fis domain